MQIMNAKPNQITIVIPCYNEEETIQLFWNELNNGIRSIVDYSFEFIFIDDGSIDNTLCLLKQLAAQDSRVRFLSLSRNFGKESAMLAGLREAAGDYIAIMDADLQDPPSLLSEMLKILSNNQYDCVGCCRITRKGEPMLRSVFARLFYKLINLVSSTKLVDGARDFKMMKREVVNALISMPEYHRFSKGLYEWVGFSTKWLSYENVERAAGETKWSFWKLLLYSMEGVVAFSTAPLALSSLLGLFFMLIAFASIFYLCARQLCWHASVSGWTSLVCIIMLFCGIQLFCMGILGQYLAKTYMETKRRPHYIIKEQSMPMRNFSH